VIRPGARWFLINRITGCIGTRPLRHDLAVEFLIMNERPWRSIVLPQLIQGEVHLLYVLFPHLAGLELSQAQDTGEGVRITARTSAGLLACPGLRDAVGAGA
jgi:hypothetical protein